MAVVVAVAEAVMVVMVVDSQGLLLSPPLTYVFCWRGWMGHGIPRTGGEYDFVPRCLGWCSVAMSVWLLQHATSQRCAQPSMPTGAQGCHRGSLGLPSK